ncbi:MAG: polymerase factor sigma-54, partial [Pseudomonadota bacterium]
MALSPRLVQRQTTQLVMTPQLQQAIKLLQMSNQELSSYIEQEIEQNPLLERESTEGGFEREAEGAGQADAGDGLDAAPEPGDAADHAAADSLPEAADQPLDTDYENDLTNDDRTGAGDDNPAEQFADWGQGGDPRAGGGTEGFGLEERLSSEPTLREHLAFQVNVNLSDPAERLIALALVDLVDEAGYLAGDIGEVADKLGVERSAVEAVLARCRGMDPAGVFARNLAECLAIQLRERDRFDPAMETLVANLELLARRDIAQIKRLCKVDDEDLAEMVAEIRSLDPKPGLTFGNNVAPPVIPDIMVRPRPDGSWQVELNAETLPRVLVNQTYFAEVRAGARNKSERDYLNERMTAANWLVRALHQRATTILKVASEIVSTQA